MTSDAARGDGVSGYVVALGTLAGVALGTILVLGPAVAIGPASVALAVFAFVASWSTVRFHRRAGLQAITLDEAVFVALLLTTGTATTVVLLTAAIALSHVVMRHAPIKVVFNVASTVLGAAAGSAVFSLLAGAAEGLAPRAILAVAVAALVYTSTGLVLVAELFRRLQGASVVAVVRETLWTNVLSWTGNVALGVVLAVIATTQSWLLAFPFLLGVGAYLGYRGHATALEDRRRLGSLMTLTRTLSEFAAEPEAVSRFMQELASSHQARGAVMGLVVDGNRELHLWGEVDERTAERLVRVAVDGDKPARLTFATDGVDALVAPLSHGGTSAGVLAVVHRSGVENWTDDALTLFTTLATEVGVTARSIELFQQVARERARWAEESRKLNDILTAASDGIATMSPAGDIVSWNPGMDALTGVGPAHAIGQPWWIVLRMRGTDDEDLLPGGDHVVTSALAGERHGDPVAVQVLRRDGQWRWVRATFSPLLSDDGEVDGTVMVARDVTAEHEVEALKADFVATVSHELRTPLTPLKGFLATVRQRSDLLTPDQIAMLHQSMESQVHRLERLVNDLLVVADLDRGRVSLSRELVRLREAVRLAISEEDPHEDRVEVHGDLDLVAAADGNAVVRILRALISNALKHSDGAVVVELSREGPDVAVRVHDDGPGIPPWEQDRIFQRFHRLGDHLHRTQGPGLGLSIAKALTDHLGGTLEVDSDVGRGATFTVRLRSAGPVPVTPSRASLGAG